MGQRDEIIAYLKTGKRVTSLEALGLFGSMQFPARIFELKELGHEVESQLVEVSSGKKVAQYWLKRCPTCDLPGPAKNPFCLCPAPEVDA
jgi:hypothetical protein